MRFCKHTLEFDDTRVHSDCSVYASGFVDFLSETPTYRLLNLFRRKNLLEDRTYSGIIRILKRAKKIEIGDSWVLAHINPGEEEVLKKLGLLQSEEPEPKRKRGRPRKQAL